MVADKLCGREKSRKRTKTSRTCSSRGSTDDGSDRPTVPAPDAHLVPQSTSEPAPSRATTSTSIPTLSFPSPLRERAGVTQAPGKGAQSVDVSTFPFYPAPSAKLLRPPLFGGVVGGDNRGLGLGPHHFASSLASSSLPTLCAPRFLGPLCPLQLDTFRGHAFGPVMPQT